MPGKKAPKAGHRRRRAQLTSQERERFSFLFERGAKVDEDKWPDVEAILQRAKARGASLDALAEALFGQLALDGFEGNRVPDDLGGFVHGAKAFDRALRCLRRMPHLLDARSLGVRPPVFLELLDAVARSLHEARATAQRMFELLTARARATSKTKPRRELIPLPGEIGRDDTRALRRAVSLAADVAPMGSPSIEYGRPPRCGVCGNPAPLLFAPR